MTTNTPLAEVYDLFMMSITDYRLTDLFNTSELDFENYLESWLIFAINDFSICDQSLNFSDTTKEFPVALTRENKTILVMLMGKYWMQKCVNDITQFNLHITDRDFKVASEAMNLREKASYLNVIKEQCSQLLNDYGYKRVDWDEWIIQSFMGV
jgi:hypothetical protein